MSYMDPAFTSADQRFFFSLNDKGSEVQPCENHVKKATF